MGKAWERGYVVVCGESLGMMLRSCVWREPGNDAT